jgi:membrane associated rhomboid family serine protease
MKFKKSVFVLPAFFVLVLIIVKYVELNFGYKFVRYGVFPRTLSGAKGILFSPFIHGDWKHLTNNAIPLLVLLSSTLYFYKSIAKEVFLWSWIMSGLWLWAFGRMNFHIGASGLVYAIASFLFFSGFLRKHNKLMAISMFVVFLYGGMIWGVFPIKEHISWEGHLAGGIAGLTLAFWFRKDGPQAQVYQYEIDELLEQEQQQEIIYHYKESQEKE